MKKLLYVILVITLILNLSGCKREETTGQEINVEVNTDLSGEDEEYLENMVAKVNEFADAIEEFERLGKNSKMTKEWRIAIAEAGANIAELGPEIVDIQATDRYINSHKAYVKAVEKILNSVVDYFEGITDGDPEKVNAFAISWEEASTLMNEATIKLEEVNLSNK